MQESNIIVRGLKVNYRMAGNGQPILILHGWRSNSQRWQKVIEFLAKKNLRVVAPDLPGFGQSQEPKKAWDLNDYAEWVSEFCQSVPELQNSFYLAGHSFGGSVAAKFAIKYSQKVEKLFLIAASCVRIITPSKKIIYNISRTAKIFYFFPYYELLRKYIYKIFFRKSDYLSASGIMKEIYKKVISEDLSLKLPFLRVPTVVIWGSYDDLTPIEHANIIHSKIKGSKLLVIEGANHALNLHVPEILAEKILGEI